MAHFYSIKKGKIRIHSLYKMKEYLQKVVLRNDENLIFKFKSLFEYFTGLSQEDLKGLDLDEFLEFPPAKEKGIMLLFIRNYLAPHFDRLQYKERESDKSIYNNHSIEASGRILPSNLPNMGKMTIKELSEDDYPLEKISLIDLSNNNLGSEDLQYVLILAEKLEREDKLFRATINLKNNRIHGIREMQSKVRLWLNRLVGLEQVEFVVMNDNPFSSVDSKDFFENLGVRIAKPGSNEEEIYPCAEILKKLIWIDNWNLFTPLWGKMLSSNDIVPYVRKAHIRYYEPLGIKKSCLRDELLVSQNDKLLVLSGIQICAVCENPIDLIDNSGGHVIEFQKKPYLIAMLSGSPVGLALRDWNSGRILFTADDNLGNHN